MICMKNCVKLKNSLRATVESHPEADYDEFPDVKVVIADGERNEDVCIKISDEGGGIRRSDIPKIFSYLFTTARNRSGMSDDEFDDYHDFSRESPLAGLGYGLPISRGYARYFGGDLQVHASWLRSLFILVSSFAFVFFFFLFLFLLFLFLLSFSFVSFVFCLFSFVLCLFSFSFSRVFLSFSFLSPKTSFVKSPGLL